MNWIHFIIPLQQLYWIFNNNQFMQERNQKIKEQPRVSQKIRRIKQPTILFVLTIIYTMQLSLDTIILYQKDMNKKIIAIIVFILFVQKMIIILFNINYVSRGNFALFVKHSLIIDSILLTSFGSVLCFATLWVLISKELFQFVYIPGYAILLLIHGGNFRLMVKYYEWKKYEIILYKISIMIGAIYYLASTCYLFIIGFKFTQGQNQNLDKTILNFLVILTGLNFSFFFQKFSKISDYDGTSLLKLDYQLIPAKYELTPKNNQPQYAEIIFK